MHDHTVGCTLGMAGCIIAEYLERAAGKVTFRALTGASTRDTYDLALE
jgi:hypothetical protein